MSITNTQLALDISTLVAQWALREKEMNDWLTGTVGGGPSNNGTYTLTNSQGVAVDIKCPAQIQADTDALTSSANAYANSASDSETQAGISESNAGNSETNANTSAVNASLVHDQAVIAKNTAQTHEANSTFLYNAFSAYYLGAKALAPTVNNLGNPLVQGALYWDTTLQLMQVRNATTWQPL